MKTQRITFLFFGGGARDELLKSCEPSVCVLGLEVMFHGGVPHI